MDEIHGYSNQLRSAPFATTGYPAAPATQQDTVGSLLDQITNLAYEVNGRISFVADSLEGNSQPKATGGNSQAGQPSTIERLRSITYLLEVSSAEANRAARALGVK